MRRFIGIKILLVVCVVMFSGCGTSKTKEGEKDRLVVTIAPLKYLVEQIVGDDCEIIVMVPEGSNPETFEPSYKQLLEVADAKLLYSCGLNEFEQRLGTEFSNKFKTKIINLSTGMKLIEGSCAHHSDRHSHIHGVDPHIWLSPRLLTQMSDVIYSELTLLYPDSLKYMDNYLELKQKLKDLDTEVFEKITTSQAKCYFIYHPAMTYYSNDYQVEQIAVEEDGKEPSVERMKTLINRARDEKIDKIFYQTQFSRSVVKALADETGAEMIEFNPLREDVIENIQEFTDIITRK